MFNPQSNQHSLGLSRNSHFLRIVHLSFVKNKIRIENFCRIPIMESLTQDPAKSLYVGNNPLSHLANRTFTITALATSEVLVRSLEINLVKERDVNAVFNFQAEPLLPYSLEEAIIDRVKLSQKDEGTQLTLLAVRKSHLQAHIDQWHLYGVEPEMISCIPLALATFSKYCIATENAHIIIHIGEEATSCVLVKNGKPLASYALPEGINAISKAMALDLNITIAEAYDSLEKQDFRSVTSDKMPKLTSLLQQMRLAFARIIYALSKQVKEQEISQIIITGPGSSFLYLKELLTENLPKEVLLPTNTLFDLSCADFNEYAIPIGLALSSKNEPIKAVNFRKEEFAYPHPWKRIKKPLTMFTVLGGICALLIYFFGQTWLNYQEDQLRERYGQLIMTQYKTLEEFEMEMRKKNALSPIPEGTSFQLKKMSSNDIEQRLAYLQHTLESTPETFPLQPNTPRVSDVLAWLSSHPNIAKEGSAEPGSPLLRIENFSYNMVKRPDQGKKQERYQVKIELDFSSPTPKLAREFHDALIAPNDFVDPKGEVKWSANRGKYHTSFFLKDKTAYPSTQGKG